MAFRAGALALWHRALTPQSPVTLEATDMLVAYNQTPASNGNWRHATPEEWRAANETSPPQMIDEHADPADHPLTDPDTYLEQSNDDWEPSKLVALETKIAELVQDSTNAAKFSGQLKIRLNDHDRRFLDAKEDIDEHGRWLRRVDTAAADLMGEVETLKAKAKPTLPSQPPLMRDRITKEGPYIRIRDCERFPGKGLGVYYSGGGVREKENYWGHGHIRIYDVALEPAPEVDTVTRKSRTAFGEIRFRDGVTEGRGLKPWENIAGLVSLTAIVTSALSIAGVF